MHSPLQPIIAVTSKKGAPCRAATIIVYLNTSKCPTLVVSPEFAKLSASLYSSTVPGRLTQSSRACQASKFNSLASYKTPRNTKAAFWPHSHPCCCWWYPAVKSGCPNGSGCPKRSARSTFPVEVSIGRMSSRKQAWASKMSAPHWWFIMSAYWTAAANVGRCSQTLRTAS